MKTSIVKPIMIKALKMVHHKLEYETVFLTPSLIGSINDRIKLLANQKGVLIPYLAISWL